MSAPPIPPRAFPERLNVAQSKTTDPVTYHDWGPATVRDNGSIGLGANGFNGQYRPNHSGIEILVNDHNASNNGSRVPFSVYWFTDQFATANQAAVEPLVFWRSRAAADDFITALKAGTAPPSIAVQPNDETFLLQAQGDDGFSTGNAVSANFGARVYPSGTVRQNVVPGEFFFQSMYDADGIVHTDCAIGQGQVWLAGSSLTMGGLRASIIYPNASNPNAADGTLVNLTLTGALNPSAALATPIAGNGEMGGYAPIEPSAVNILLQSGNFGATPWTLTTAAAAAAAIVDPLGGAAAMTLSTSGIGGKTLQQGITVAASSQTYTASVYWHSSSAGTQFTLRATPVGGMAYSLIYTPATGVVAVTPGATGTMSKRYQTPDGGYWYRMVLVFPNAGQTQLRLELFPNGTAGMASSAVLFGAQIEAAAKASSYIATTTATASRAAGISPNRIPVFTGTSPGVVPASGGSSSTYLRGDGTWATPTPQSSPSPYTWANRPSASGNSSLLILVTDIGDGGSLWASNGTDWVPTSATTIARSAVASSTTGTSTETQLASVTLPAGVLGHNGAIEIDTLWSFTGSTNAKVLRARYSGSGGAAYISQSVSTASAVSERITTKIRNRGATNSQVAPAAVSSGGTGVASAAVITSAVDTTAATTVYISGTLSTTTETITLEAYEVRVLP